MEDFVAGWLAMPLWAQIGVAFFVFTFVVMLVEPGVKRRRHAARHRALAQAHGTTTTRVDAFTEWFSVTAEGRAFEVRRELRTRGGVSYRGPTGHLLVISTPLAGSRWELHQADIMPGRVPTWLGGPGRVTGDAAFDGRFMVKQDGVPVRDGWLDAPTRAAVTAFFDTPWVDGRVWVQEGRLQHLALRPKTVDANVLGTVLRQQSALTTALERTGGWRGPST